jgi:hypothetical protein
MIRDAAGDTNEAQSIVVVSHWAEEVKAKMPARK